MIINEEKYSDVIMFPAGCIIRPKAKSRCKQNEKCKHYNECLTFCSDLDWKGWECVTYDGFSPAEEKIKKSGFVDTIEDAYGALTLNISTK